MENKNKKMSSIEPTQGTNVQLGQKAANMPEDSSHEKHVHAGQKGVEACCKKMGPGSICCGKK